VKHQEVPNKEATVETIGALEDYSGDQQPAAGYQNPLKRWTKDVDVQRTDISEEMTDVAGVQQRHKGLIPIRAAISGKQENCQ
jgi:hypothetical protein